MCVFILLTMITKDFQIFFFVMCPFSVIECWKLYEYISHSTNLCVMSEMKKKFFYLCRIFVNIVNADLW